MKEFLLRTGNAYEYMTDNINAIGMYSDKTLAFPNVDSIINDGSISPELFLDAYSGSQLYSELNAIQLYRTYNDTYDALSEMYLAVAIVEMQHFERLSGLIVSLGGSLIIPYSNNELSTVLIRTSSVKDSLIESIESEKHTIAHYKYIMEEVSLAPDSPTKEIVIQLLNKLIADERRHIAIFQEQLNKY